MSRKGLQWTDAQRARFQATMEAKRQAKANKAHRKEEKEAGRESQIHDAIIFLKKAHKLIKQRDEWKEEDQIGRAHV